MLDVFNALTLPYKITVIGITCLVIVMVYFMYRIMRKPQIEYDITLPDGTVERITEEVAKSESIAKSGVPEEILSESTEEKESEIVDEGQSKEFVVETDTSFIRSEGSEELEIEEPSELLEDKEFEEEKKKIESFGKKEIPEESAKDQLKKIVPWIVPGDSHKEKQDLKREETRKEFLRSKEAERLRKMQESIRKFESSSSVTTRNGVLTYRRISPLRIRHPIEPCAGCNRKFDLMLLAEGNDGLFYCPECIDSRLKRRNK